ncbi:unnamed protein product [Leptosia nina]|uniref:Uncharacterized protein n=1 Tax=Leptosia nina TaxID=320188 RepID=A0AAV1J2X3_9NEOP
MAHWYSVATPPQRECREICLDQKTAFKQRAFMLVTRRSPTDSASFYGRGVKGELWGRREAPTKRDASPIYIYEDP